MKLATGRVLLILVSFSLVVSMFVSVGPIGAVQASAPTYVAHSPIHIDKNSDLKTLESTGGWTGSGTVSDPYVINGFEISSSGGNGSSCIYIGNCSAYVVISNCYLHGADYGIQLRLSSMVTMTDNNCTDVAARYGIYFNQSNNDTASNNVCIVRSHGIFMLTSDDNTISNNTCRATAACAIMLKNSSNSNTFSDNTCYSSGDNGIYLLFSCDNNLITNNTLKDNIGQGVTVSVSNDNRIFGNDFIGNQGNDTKLNPLHHQAYDDGLNNQWNTTSYGNYWSDWTTPDSNGDGIVDIPYTIAGGSSEDHFPLDHLITPGTTVPGVPTGLTAIAGSGQVSLSWSAPSSNGGAAIDYYVIYQNNTDVAHVTSNSTIISGLTNGLSYSFNVAAHNPDGIGARTSAVTATPTESISVPGVPTGLTATSGDAQVSLSWTAPTSDGNASIVYYIVYQNGIDVVHPATNSTTITGLTNGQSYAFTVAAHNSVGNGTQTAGVSSTPNTSASVPGAPTGLNVTPGDSLASLSWAAPGSNGSATIDYYLVYVNGVALANHYTSVSTTITGLTNGQQYTFTIAAHNSVGIGSPSSAVTIVPAVAPTVPGIPTGLKATPGNDQVSLSWTAPGSNGGMAIDYYIVYQNGIAIYHPTTTSQNVTSLTNGQSYNFTVAAHNSVGTGARTSAVTPTPGSGAAVPGVPADLVATAGDGKVTLSWSAPSDSSSIDYYIVYQNGVDVSHTSVTSATITGLTNGENYSFTVAAHNSGGVGTMSPSRAISPSAAGNGATTTPGTDMILSIGAVALLAAIIAIALVVRGRRKTE
jgi:parallel beta-helix repeat protein